ncbi:MAG: GDSL-type esterase/lipase family protein [Clostridiales bacterium]|nr:GDSL-type esterase/lipase family protein [Clostridiales bacterium]
MKYILSLLLLMGSITAWGEQRISPSNKDIVIEGALYLKYEGDRAILNRHSDQLWNNEDVRIAQKNARTPSGVRIIFKTNSKTVKLLFSDRKDAVLRKATNFYGIYKNGKFLSDVSGDELTLTSQGDATEWEIVLPVFYGVDFEGIVIDDNAKLYKVKRSKRPVYVAIGNSITHGAGLKNCGSEKSYPYVLAQVKGYNLYNLAVGGSQISPAIAQELKGMKVDIITVMWGFNDWNATKGNIEEIAKRYTQLLTGLRKYQPKATIYCILPSTARDENGAGAKPPLSAVRNAERQLVESLQKAGDKKLFFIDGSKISSVDELEGNVHFNNDGARHFGEALAKQIK